MHRSKFPTINVFSFKLLKKRNNYNNMKTWRMLGGIQECCTSMCLLLIKKKSIYHKKKKKKKRKSEEYLCVHITRTFTSVVPLLHICKMALTEQGHIFPQQVWFKKLLFFHSLKTMEFNVFYFNRP